MKMSAVYEYEGRERNDIGGYCTTEEGFQRYLFKGQLVSQFGVFGREAGEIKFSICLILSRKKKKEIIDDILFSSTISFSFFTHTQSMYF